MNLLKSLLLAVLSGGFFIGSANAQWQGPNHAVPIGRGAGVTGFGSASPGTSAFPLVSNGTTSDPSFQALTGAGIASGTVANSNLANASANSIKCNPTGVSAAVQDCTASQVNGITGGIVGPASSTTGHIATFTDTTGKNVQDGSSISTNQAFTFNANTTFNGGSNTFSGASNFNGNAYFGSGKPWFDVLSTAQSCAAADPTGATDSTSAIQCHINYMETTYGGGVVFFPPGSYKTTSTITVPQAIWLEGSGAWITTIGNTTSDFNVIQFAINTSSTTCPSGNHYGGMEKLGVQGYANAAASHSDVIVGDGCNVTIRDANLFYGGNALYNRGADGLVEGVFASAYGTNLLSAGANWYVRDKFDSGIANAVYGYSQVASVVGNPAENHFTQCDFSVTGATNTIIINDTTSAITVFSGIVNSGPISIASKATMFTGGEIGGSSFVNSSGYLSVVGSYGFGGLTITGAGARSCAGNSNITC